MRLARGARIIAIVESARGHIAVFRGAALIALIIGLLRLPVGTGKPRLIAVIVGLSVGSIGLGLVSLGGPIATVKRAEAVAFLRGSAGGITLLIGIRAGDVLRHGTCDTDTQERGTCRNQRESMNLSHGRLLSFRPHEKTSARAHRSGWNRVPSALPRQIRVSCLVRPIRCRIRLAGRRRQKPIRSGTHNFWPRAAM